MADPIRTERHGAVLAADRPAPRRATLDFATADAMSRAMDGFEANDELRAAVVVTAPAAPSPRE